VTPDIEINNGQFLPSHWAFENYVQMWSTINLAQGLFNSILVSIIASTIAVFLAAGTAYVITRFHFRGRIAYLYSLVGLQAIPSVMLLLPLFVLFISIQSVIHVTLVGTYTGVIITSHDPDPGGSNLTPMETQTVRAKRSGSCPPASEPF